MAEIINLNRVRKARARAAEETQAAGNRVKFGRTKAEKLAAKAEETRLARLHAGLMLADADKPDTPEKS